jgi:hypothetical protein
MATNIPYGDGHRNSQVKKDPRLTEKTVDLSNAIPKRGNLWM